MDLIPRRKASGMALRQFSPGNPWDCGVLKARFDRLSTDESGRRLAAQRPGEQGFRPVRSSGPRTVLGLGMLAGSDGPGGISFNDAVAAQFLGVAALALILFSGGLSTSWREVRPVLGYSLSLATVGVLATALVFGLFAWYALGLKPLEGMLLGSIVSSTRQLQDFETPGAMAHCCSRRSKIITRPICRFTGGCASNWKRIAT